MFRIKPLVPTTMRLLFVFFIPLSIPLMFDSELTQLIPSLELKITPVPAAIKKLSS